MKRSLILALVVTGFGAFVLWAGRNPILADSSSSLLVVLTPTPTPCLPLSPCGLGSKWDPKLCQCVPDSPPIPIPSTPFPGSIPTITIVQAMGAMATPCAPPSPCGIGSYWDAKLCQCVPNAPAMNIPIAPFPTPSSK